MFFRSPNHKGGCHNSDLFHFLLLTFVFQTFFGLQKVTGDNQIQEILVPGNKDVKVQWGKLLLEPYQLSQQEGQFDLLLEFFEGEKLFSGVFKYNSEIFEEDRILKMGSHLETILKEITKKVEVPR